MCPQTNILSRFLTARADHATLVTKIGPSRGRPEVTFVLFLHSESNDHSLRVIEEDGYKLRMLRIGSIEVRKW
jgi:hypothetical protein